MVFRGAGGAPGRTSWQSKPEKNDYISVIGFLVYYLYHLRPPKLSEEFESSENLEAEHQGHILRPIPSQVAVDPKSATEKAPASSQEDINGRPLLILSGYSYGALITTSLPAILVSVLSQFQTPAEGSPQAEIRLRAAFLADQQNGLMNGRISTLISTDAAAGEEGAGSAPESPRARAASSSSSGGVRIGGHEDLRKSSHESHRSRASVSLDPHVKRSIEMVRSMAIGKGKALNFPHHHQRHSSAGSLAPSPLASPSPSISTPMQGAKKGPERSSKVVAGPEAAGDRGSTPPPGPIPNAALDVRVAYLLVSPLHGWINSLATMSLFGTRPRHSNNSSRPDKGGGTSLAEHEAKLAIDPTLALFGDDDVFVSVNKLRAWAERIHGADGRGGGRPNFVHKEVSGAGHFWHDHEALQILREEVKVFVSSL